MTEDGLVDADAIAVLLNIPRGTVLDLARRQLIPSYRFSRKLIRFDKAEVCATADDKLKINARRGRRPGEGRDEDAEGAVAALVDLVAADFPDNAS